MQLYSLPGGGAMLISTGGDAETRVWERPGSGKANDAAAPWRLRQTISVDGKLQLSAALSALDVEGNWCARAVPGHGGCVAGLFSGAWLAAAPSERRRHSSHFP